MADNLETTEANDAKDQNRDGRSAMARGYVLASRAMSIGFQMIIPVGVGWWADSAPPKKSQPPADKHVQRGGDKLSGGDS